MTISDLVRRADHDGVAVVMLNAPESINALSEAMLEALSDEFDRISEDRSVKAVILRSAGKHFWTVLLDTDGGAESQHPPEVRNGDAATGRVLGSTNKPI